MLYCMAAKHSHIATINRALQYGTWYYVLSLHRTDIIQYYVHHTVRDVSHIISVASYRILIEIDPFVPVPILGRAI
jgi:hypothetical protein